MVPDERSKELPYKISLNILTLLITVGNIPILVNLTKTASIKGINADSVYSILSPGSYLCSTAPSIIFIGRL